MTDPTAQHTNAGSTDQQPPVRFSGLCIEIPPFTDVTAFTNSGILLAVGPPIAPDVTIRLGSSQNAHDFLTQALQSVIALDPQVAAGPDPRVVEARDIVAEDLLRLAGAPLHAGARPVEEFSTSDLRTIRRLAARQLDLLDEAIAAATVPGRSLRAVGA